MSTPGNRDSAAVLQMPNRLATARVSEAQAHENASAEATSGDDALQPRADGEVFAYVPVDRVRVSPYQTRAIAAETELEELVRSIEQKGVIQPVLVRPLNDEPTSAFRFELIAGERRLKAARAAGLAFIPALVQPLADREAAELSVIENTQRENLNPIEEALAYQQLTVSFGLTQTEVARATGKNRATVSNSLRLLQLSPDLIELLRSGVLTAGHGRALLTIDEPKVAERFGRRAAEQGLSVRALEHLIARWRDAKSDAAEEDVDEEAERLELQLQRQTAKISDCLGVEHVELRYDSAGNRRLNLVFETEASFKRFMAKIRS
ncbi:MAG: ParB/RepB/Spo0J family partition protein [Bdellovibrionales bacterium]|nr:ParB/RepB/Spo0J family partition protein [Bdellovibrionales bacterium]